MGEPGMDYRPYFIVGDLVSNILVGAVVGLLCAVTVSVGWPMFVVMLFTMLLGMGVALMLFFPLSILFGAMEIMLPTMFSGMMSGMVVGMWCTMAPQTPGSGAMVGSVCALVSLVVLWVIDYRLRGVRHYGEGGSHAG